MSGSDDSFRRGRPRAKRPDEYALREKARSDAYRRAFMSPEVQRWIAGLSPAERERARAAGLLDPYFDAVGGRDSLDDMTPAQEPSCEFVDQETQTEKETAQQEFQTFCRLPDSSRVIIAALRELGDPELNWACLRYLLGSGSCASHADALGMSRQDFHYHVGLLQGKLGLARTRLGKSERARRVYSTQNRRRGNAGKSSRHVNMTTKTQRIFGTRI